MSYRGFKRVLGETSLERKCRVLFGANLLLLITAAFVYAGWRTEKLVKEGPIRTGQLFVDEKILSYHYVHMTHSEDRTELDRQRRKTAKKLYNAIGRDYSWEILVLDLRGVEPADPLGPLPTRLFKTNEELELLDTLRDEVDLAFEKYGRQRLVVPESDLPRDRETPDPVEEASLDKTSPFQNPPRRLLQVGDDYHYYQPVFWHPACTASCHRVANHRPEVGLRVSRYAYSTAEWNKLKDHDGEPKLPVFRVMKVVIPGASTRDELLETRGILAALAISTVFFSMLALYAVVRYVIVKPLNHLRDVSDEISRGNYNLRAAIQTRDEFEELGASFNRMLRHLVDAQSELRNVNNDLDAKLDQLAQANLQLHEMNRLKSDFLASMSHELRTPLNSIIGFADVLKENVSLDDKQRRYAANIASSGRSLLELINDILDLAKTESGKMEVRLTEFDIHPVVNSQCELVRSLSEEKNIDLTAHIQRGLPPLYQDQGKIQQVLINLLSNAIKFTPEGGRITVTAERDSMRHLVLTVEDTGVGIKEEERTVIFEKFRQGGQNLGGDHLLTREYSGTGLGLSIVRELSKLLGGEVFFESEVGKGSAFHIRVPWTLADMPRIDASIQQRLDEVTKPRRIDFKSLAPPHEDAAPKDGVANPSADSTA